MNKDEFKGACPNCRGYFDDLYLHYSVNYDCYQFILSHRDRINKIIDCVNTLGTPQPKKEKVLDFYLDRIVLTNHGYWCRRRDVPETAKIIKDSVYYEYPNPTPKWMIEDAKEHCDTQYIKQSLINLNTNSHVIRCTEDK